MARLEIDIALNNLQGATTGLKTLQDSLKQLSGKGVKIDVGANSLNEMKASLIANKVELEKQKIGIIEVAKAGKELDNQNKVTRNSIAQLTEESKRYNLEQKKLRDEQKASKGLDLKVTGEGSIVAMRAKLRDLTKTYDNLSASQRNNSNTNNTLLNDIKRLNSELSRAEQASGRYQRQVGNYEKATYGATGVTMEFNRIIQDAPFGMMGIGNNIQQLTSNWSEYTRQAKAAAAANGATVTSMGLVKGVMSSFLTTGNLLTLGIAAATSAWTAYTMWQQRSNKEAKETERTLKATKDALTEYVDSLNSVNSAQLKGAQGAESELSRLKILKSIYDNSNVSLKNRREAYNDIIGMYESYFGKLSTEEKSVFNLTDRYNKLTNAVMQTAMARAYQQEMEENAVKLRALEKKANSEISRYNKEKQKQNDQELVFREALLGNYGKEAQALANIEAVQKGISKGGLGSQMENQKQQAKLNKLLQEYNKTWGGINAVNADNADLLDRINKIAENGVVITKSGLDVDNKRNTTLEKAVKLVNNYLELLKEISSISGLGSVDYSTLGKVGIDLEVGKVKAELDQVLREIDAYKTKVLNDTTISESQRTNLIAKANADREILEGRHLAKMKILQQDYTKRIEEMTVKPVKTVATMDEIQSTEDPEWMKKQKELTRAIKSEINNILNMLPNLSGGFSDIFAQLTNGLNDILQKALVERLGEMITKKMKQLDDETQMIAGALAVAGKTLQGLFSKTSGVGQGIGGAMSGAGAGLGIGSMLASTLGKSAGPWGAAIGGAIGLVSGIIGAKKAKKQEEMQRKQLEEQKKANALLERMNALAYTSSIIGGQSQYGIVSGVNRNAQGEFTFKIDGRDLVAVMGNNERLIGR